MIKSSQFTYTNTKATIHTNTNTSSIFQCPLMYSTPLPPQYPTLYMASLFPLLSTPLLLLPPSVPLGPIYMGFG